MDAVFGGTPPAAGATFQQSALSSAIWSQELGYVRGALSVSLTFHLSQSVAIGIGPELWLDFIVRRLPDYGAAFQQLPPGDESRSLEELYPVPASYRFQVGLSTMLVIAI